MGKSPYLGNYSILNEDDLFSIVFQIPDNCNYKADEDSTGVYTISVFLKPAVKKPSNIFVTITVGITCNENDDLEVGFLLPEEAGNLGLAKKPKILVNALLG